MIHLRDEAAQPIDIHRTTLLTRTRVAHALPCLPSLSVFVCSDEAARKAAAVAGSAAAKNGKAQGATAPPDPDPFGESTLSREPLAEASRFLHFLQLHSSTALPTHLWAMEVQLRKAKWLLAWKAIKQARQLQADNAELHFGLMRWLEGIQQARDHLQPLVREVLEEEWTEAGHTGSMMDADIALLNDQHLRSHLHNLDHRFAGQQHASSHAHPHHPPHSRPHPLPFHHPPVRIHLPPSARRL